MARSNNRYPGLDGEPMEIGPAVRRFDEALELYCQGGMTMPTSYLRRLQEEARKECDEARAAANAKRSALTGRTITEARLDPARGQDEEVNLEIRRRYGADARTARSRHAKHLRHGPIRRAFIRLMNWLAR